MEKKITKKELKLAKKMLHDIEYLTYFWHITVSTPDRDVIRKALLLFCGGKR